MTINIIRDPFFVVWAYCTLLNQSSGETIHRLVKENRQRKAPQLILTAVLWLE